MNTLILCVVWGGLCGIFIPDLKIGIALAFVGSLIIQAVNTYFQ
jgi:hypothetical protein